MRSLKLLIVFLTAFFCVAAVPNSGKYAGSSSSYVGPGDVVSGATAWWGLRCYNNAYTGSVVDVADASTGNTTGTRLVCSGGNVSALVSASACTFVTGNACSALATTCAVSCVIVTFYDQSGANSCSSAPCNQLSNANSNRATYTANCKGSLPCGTFVATNTQCYSSAAIATITAATVSFVAERNGATSAYGDVISINSGSVQSGFSNSVNTALAFAGTVTTATAADSAFHSVQIIYASTRANSSIDVDGSSTTVNPGTGVVTSTLGIGAAGTTCSGGNKLTGLFAEGGVWPIAFNSTQLTNMTSNQRSYWGF